MKDICIVTTFERDELLFLCLEAIRKADPRVTIAVFSDHGRKSFDLVQICFQAGANLFITDEHNSYGNSFNLISGARFALNTEYDIVHLIEDDTFIHPEYLNWARRMLNQGIVTKTVTTHLRNFPMQPETFATEVEPIFAAVCARIPSKHLESWYESPCASWNAQYLKQALSHIIPEYFAADRKEMQRVLDTAIFPKSRFLRGGAEQDGFFLRCVEHYNWRTRFPEKPLATHFGHYGYNRRGAAAPEGDLAQRIQFTRELLKNERRRIELFGEDITRKEMEGERQ